MCGTVSERWNGLLRQVLLQGGAFDQNAPAEANGTKAAIADVVVHGLYINAHKSGHFLPRQVVGVRGCSGWLWFGRAMRVGFKHTGTANGSVAF